MREKEIVATVQDFMPQIERVSMAIMGEVIGVAQALGELRNALDAIDNCLDTREFDRASHLGYSDASSAFIFLQRALGGLQSAADAKDNLIADIGITSGAKNHEEVLPHVKAVMFAIQPMTEVQKKKRQTMPGKKVPTRKVTA